MKEQFKPMLELPVDNLAERRAVLEKELDAVVTVIVENKISEEINARIAQHFPGNTWSSIDIEWDFYPESDDEGGSVYYPTSLEVLYDGDHKDDEDESILVQDGKCSYPLNELIRDIVSDYSDDLYEYNIYFAKVNLKKEDN